MNRLFPLMLAALALATPASAQISAFQHVIIVIQENRTPDNCSRDCAHQQTQARAASTHRPNSTTSRQRGGWIRPRKPGRPIQGPFRLVSSSILLTSILRSLDSAI